MPQDVSKSRTEIKDIQRLRRLFLEAGKSGGLADYWQDEALVALYDSTLARRIAWKWDAVLGELAKRQWSPARPISRWIDWGCGSGVACEALLNSDLLPHPDQIALCDRSAVARQFAGRKIAAMAQSSEIAAPAPEQLQITSTDLVLVSHVINELPRDKHDSLMKQLGNAGCILWVEPGTPDCSKSLAHARWLLLDHFNLDAPCPHTKTCPLQDRTSDWCHFFATPPAEIFQDSFWSHFARETDIDLRSLPVSFLALNRKSSNLQISEKFAHAALTERIIGRPRFYKGHAKVLLCGADGAAREKNLQQRNLKKEFKSWQKDCFFAEVTSDQDSD